MHQHSTISINLNLNTGEGVVKFEMNWVLAGITFSGNIHGKMVGAPFASGTANYAFNDLHGVLQGPDGQTLMLDGSKPIGQPFTWTGTIIMP